MSDATPAARREPVFNMPAVVVICCGVLLAIYAVYSFASDATQDWLIATFAFVPARLAIALGVAQGAVQASPAELAARSADRGAGVGRRALVDARHLRVPARQLGACRVQLPVARGLRRAGGAAFRGGALPRAAAARGHRRRAGAVPRRHGELRAGHRRLGRHRRGDGRRGAVRLPPLARGGDPVRRSQLDAAFRQPALSLVETFTTKAALVFIVFWFVTNLIFGLYPSLSGISERPIAWPAHIGGFMTGLLALPAARSATPGGGPWSRRSPPTCRWRRRGRPARTSRRRSF